MDNTKAMDIIAYYLSEYDMEAVLELGYESRSDAFKKIGRIFGKDNSYLKRLRDEYDVVTSSSRNGQCNRPPRKRINKVASYMKQFSFDEITEVVKSLLAAEAGELVTVEDGTEMQTGDKEYSETELENIINFEDSGATVRIKTSDTTVRVYDPSIIRQMKKLYKGNCQICGCKPFVNINSDLTEVHHIDYFSKFHNNNSSNLVVLCPNHHRLIHKLNPVYDRELKCFVYPDGSKETIVLNYHL